MPVHVLAINALGLHLLDYLQFEDLVPLCEAAGRWSSSVLSPRCDCPAEPVPPSIRSSIRSRSCNASRGSGGATVGLLAGNVGVR